jgi:hypothetical protein
MISPDNRVSNGRLKKFRKPPRKEQEEWESLMWRDWSKALRELLQIPGESGGAYRPDLHYMRGPGPKWHAKRAGFLADPVAAKSDAAALHEIAEHRA